MLGFFSFSAVAFDCQPIAGLTFPLKESSQSSGKNVFVPEKACLNGKDVTESLTNGGILTSSINVNNSELFFVTTRNKKDNYFSMIAVYETSNGRAAKLVMFDNNPNYPTTPKNSLQDMVINYYDNNKAILFFSTQAWAQSDAIHILVFPENNSIRPIYEKFLTDGEFIEYFDNKIIVRKIKHDNKGAYFPVVEVDMKGKEVCEIDTRTNGWTLAPLCLQNGESLKMR
jgi:hypothetical protein